MTATTLQTVRKRRDIVLGLGTSKLLRLSTLLVFDPFLCLDLTLFCVRFDPFFVFGVDPLPVRLLGLHAGDRVWGLRSISRAFFRSLMPQFFQTLAVPK